MTNGATRSVRRSALARIGIAVYWFSGFALLAVVLASVDLDDALAALRGLGWQGAAAVMAIYAVAFFVDSVSWHLTLPAVPLRPVWVYRLWRVRLVGELFNTVVPAGSMGGEPLKALLLRDRYGIDLKAAATSLVVAKTVNLVALVIFLTVGFVFILGRPDLSVAFSAAAGAGLFAFALGIFGFYAVQRYRLSGIVGTWLSRRPLFSKLNAVLHHVQDMDARLHGFYTRHRKRLMAALALALLNWVLGTFEMYAVFAYLGQPVSFWEAWIIEAAVQLVRAGVFFIPGALGAQEGVFLLVVGAVTGNPALGLAAAAVRRLREVAWLLFSAALGWRRLN